MKNVWWRVFNKSNKQGGHYITKRMKNGQFREIMKKSAKPEMYFEALE